MMSHDDVLPVFLRRCDTLTSRGVGEVCRVPQSHELVALEARAVTVFGTLVDGTVYFR